MLSVGSIIPAVYVHASPYGTSSGSLRVYVPEIMSMLSQGMPKSTPTATTGTGYASAPDCKPTVPGTVPNQNYITASPSGKFEHPYLRYGARVYVKILNEELDLQVIPVAEDNSFIP